MKKKAILLILVASTLSAMQESSSTSTSVAKQKLLLSACLELMPGDYVTSYFDPSEKKLLLDKSEIGHKGSIKSHQKVLELGEMVHSCQFARMGDSILAVILSNHEGRKKSLLSFVKDPWSSEIQTLEFFASPIEKITNIKLAKAEDIILTFYTSTQSRQEKHRMFIDLKTFEVKQVESIKSFLKTPLEKQ